jgi:hypothetical protein
MASPKPAETSPRGYCRGSPSSLPVDLLRQVRIYLESVLFYDKAHLWIEKDLALVENNARRAAEIARLLVQRPSGSVSHLVSSDSVDCFWPSPRLVCLALNIRVV